MNIQNLSGRKFLKIICACSSLMTALLLFALYLATGNGISVIFGLTIAATFFCWGAVILKYYQMKLRCFSDSLCLTLDGMMNGNERPQVDYEAETLLARISHRMERLYHVMLENRNKVEEDRAKLQSLVSDISHQTKTPIANLKMLNETILERPISGEQRRELLYAARSQLDKLDFLIQAMVKTSRLETGIITLEKKEAPIADTVVAAINGILNQLEKKQIALSVNCPEDLTVSHDSRWTAEALFNLLDNAVKYTPPGGSVTVLAERWEMYLKLDVTDTGRGIPESAHAAIFQRFYREESVRGTDGIGIGLYLAREIITMQGGYIKVASEEGKGAAFTIFLPYQ